MDISIYERSALQPTGLCEPARSLSTRLAAALSASLRGSRIFSKYLGLVLFFLHLACTCAMAQSNVARAGEPPAYRATVTEAVAEYDAGHFEEARALFNKANSLYSTARVLRGLGMVEFELRNYSDSVDYLVQALQSKVQPLEGALRTETERLLERARGFIAQLELAVDPGEATVVVDGTPVSLGAGGRLVLEVGDHVLEFSAQGYRPEKRVLKVRGGEQQALRIVLPAERITPDALQVKLPNASSSSTSMASVPVDEGEPSRKPLYKNPWLWTGVGVAVAALAVGLGVGLSKGDPRESPAIAQNPSATLVGP